MNTKRKFYAHHVSICPICRKRIERGTEMNFRSVGDGPSGWAWVHQTCSLETP